MRKNRQYKKAISEIKTSQQWPERLGVGKPYENDIDERLENFLLYQCYVKSGDKNKSDLALQQIKSNKAGVYTINDVLSKWADGHAAIPDTVTATKTDVNSRVLAEWLKIK